MVAPATAQVFDEKYDHWPEETRINGRVFIDHGLSDFEGVRSILERVAKNKSVVAFATDPDAHNGDWSRELRDAIGDGHFSSIVSANPSTDLMVATIATADCVLIESLPDELLQSEDLAKALAELIDRSGTLFVDSSLASQLGSSRVKDSELVAGWGLIPDSLVQCQATSGDSITELNKYLAVAREQQTPLVGIKVDPGTALLLSGRKLTCYGDGCFTLTVPKTETALPRTKTLGPRESRRQSPETYLADLTQWRREAMDRMIGAFPPANPPTPEVPRGTLLIVGGGGSPKGLMDRFVELAGGVENARLVYVPCSESDNVGNRHGIVESWRRMGVQHATFIHTKDRNQANTDEEFLAPLKDATGIYFGGGRQWNFADSYYGTEAHRLMKEVLRRGGVIGGSSAGASIQARYLARATPIGNQRIMAFGYERGGLGFIGGVAIDQHFTQRGRQRDMTELMSVHPQLLGIGIDEATAIEVSGTTAKVSGPGRVHFYDRNQPVIEGEPDYIALPKGSIYDLAKREIVVDTSGDEETASDAR